MADTNAARQELINFSKFTDKEETAVDVLYQKKTDTMSAVSSILTSLLDSTSSKTVIEQVLSSLKDPKSLEEQQASFSSSSDIKAKDKILPPFFIKTPYVQLKLNGFEIYPNTEILQTDGTSYLSKDTRLNFQDLDLEFPFGGLDATIQGKLKLFTKDPETLLNLLDVWNSAVVATKSPDGFPTLSFTFGWYVETADGEVKIISSPEVNTLVMNIDMSGIEVSGTTFTLTLQDRGSAVLKHSSADLVLLENYPQEQLRVLLEGVLKMRLFTLDDFLQFKDLNDGTTHQYTKQLKDHDKASENYYTKKVEDHLQKLRIYLNEVDKERLKSKYFNQAIEGGDGTYNTSSLLTDVFLKWNDLKLGVSTGGSRPAVTQTYGNNVPFHPYQETAMWYTGYAKKYIEDSYSKLQSAALDVVRKGIHLPNELNSNLAVSDAVYKYGIPPTGGWKIITETSTDTVQYDKLTSYRDKLDYLYFSLTHFLCSEDGKPRANGSLDSTFLSKENVREIDSWWVSSYKQMASDSLTLKVNTLKQAFSKILSTWKVIPDKISESDVFYMDRVDSALNIAVWKPLREVFEQDWKGHSFSPTSEISINIKDNASLTLQLKTRLKQINAINDLLNTSAVTGSYILTWFTALYSILEGRATQHSETKRALSGATDDNTFFVTSKVPAVRINGKNFETVAHELAGRCRCKWYPHLNARASVSKEEEAKAIKDIIEIKRYLDSDQKEQAQSALTEHTGIKDYNLDYLKQYAKQSVALLSSKCSLYYVPNVPSEWTTSSNQHFKRVFEPTKLADGTYSWEKDQIKTNMIDWEEGAWFLLPDMITDYNIIPSTVPITYGPGASSFPYLYGSAPNLMASLSQAKNKTWGVVSNIRVSHDTLTTVLASAANESVAHIADGSSLTTAEYISKQLTSTSNKLTDAEQKKKFEAEHKALEVSINKKRTNAFVRANEVRQSIKAKGYSFRWKGNLGFGADGKVLTTDNYNYKSASKSGSPTSTGNGTEPVEMKSPGGQYAFNELKSRMSMFLKYPTAITIEVPGDPNLVRLAPGHFELLAYYPIEKSDKSGVIHKLNTMISGVYTVTDIKHNISLNGYTTTLQGLKLQSNIAELPTESLTRKIRTLVDAQPDGQIPAELKEAISSVDLSTQASLNKYVAGPVASTLLNLLSTYTREGKSILNESAQKESK